MNLRTKLTTAATAAAAFACSSGPSQMAIGPYPTEPPPPTELRPLQFPEFDEATLDNGLRIVVVENHELPIVSMNLTMHAGTSHDPQGLEGLASMTATLLTKGTESRTAEEIAETIEGVGGSLNAGAGTDFFSISSTVLTDDVDLGFDLISDVLLRPSFPEEELERERQRTLSALQLERSQPSALASRFFFERLYGNHPYGRDDSEASVNAITREDLVEYTSEMLKPDGALLVVSGDISLGRVRDLVNRYLDGWTGGGQELEFPAPPRPRPTNILLVHRPGSDQSNIVVGNIGMRVGDPGFYASTVGNRILGGGADSRLFLILREEKGWTYGAGSGFAAQRKDIGYFRASTQVRNSVTDSALVELLNQLRRIQNEPVTDEELNGAKGYLIGSFPRSIETPRQIAGQVSTVKLLNLPEDYLETYRARLDSVDQMDIMNAMSELVDPDNLVIVVVGDGAEIYDKLDLVGRVSIVDVDGNPMTPAALNAVPAEWNAEAVNERERTYRVMFQGQEAGTTTVSVTIEDGVASISQEMDITVQGTPVSQNSNMRFRIEGIQMLDSRSSTAFGPVAMESQATYEGDRVTGTGQQPGPGGIQTVDIDTTLAPGTIDTEALTALLPTLDLREGSVYSTKAFEISAGEVKSVTIRVAGVEEVTVPAGTFETLRLEVTGLDSDLTQWVTNDDMKTTVKVVPTGQPVVLELTEMM